VLAADLRTVLQKSNCACSEDVSCIMAVPLQQAAAISFSAASSSGTSRVSALGEYTLRSKVGLPAGGGHGG
jgi:hypothetical protein